MGTVLDGLVREPPGENNRDIAGALADVVGIIGAFLRLPTPELAMSIGDGSLDDALLGSVDLLRSLGAVGVADEEVSFSPVEGRPSNLEELRRDYTRLLNHPHGPAIEPYEAAFCTDKQDRPLLAVNAVAQELDGMYRRFGYARMQGGFVPGDHIAMELQFLELSLECVARGGSAALCAVRELWELHGRRWWGKFFLDIAHAAETAEYGIVGRLGSALFGGCAT